jgi:hypothetical protein
MNVLRVAVLWGLLYLATSATWAAPHLQLYIDPSQNSNAAYNSISKGWETTANPMTLSAFMHGLGAAHTYRIIVSLLGRSSENNPNEKMTVTITDSTGKETVASLDTWTFGTPALYHDSDDQSFHIALFPTWHATFDFKFSSADGFSVFDVRSQQGETPGFRKDFLLTFSGPQSDTFYHFDLLDVDTGEFAPLTHDAQRKRKKSSSLFPPLAFGSSAGGVGLLGGFGHSNEPGGGATPSSGLPSLVPPWGSPGGAGGDLTSPFGSLNGSGSGGGSSGSSGSSSGGVTGGGASGGSSGSSGASGGNTGGNTSGITGSFPVKVTHSPEPSTIVLLLTGAAALFLIQCRQRGKRQKA